MEKSNVFMKILWVIGGIFGAVILALLILFIVPRAVSGIGNMAASISSLISGSAPNTIDISSNKDSVQSGESFAISWNDRGYKEGDIKEYTLVYTCTEGLQIQLDGRNINCGIQNDVTYKNNQATLTAIFNTSTYTDTEITINSIQNGKITGKGKAVITVRGNDAPEERTNTNSTYSTDSDSPIRNSAQEDNSGQSSVSTNNGSQVSYTSSSPADISVSNIQTGIIRNGIFYTTSRVDDNELPAVRFVVSNIGGRATGNWYFNYAIPTEDVIVFNSGIQSSLRPGDSIQYTIVFNQYSEGDQAVGIYIDPQNIVPESNEYNNSSFAEMYFESDREDNYGSYNGSYGNSTGFGSYDKNDDADLIVDILDYGRYSNGRFYDDNEVDSDDDVAVLFRVKNQGGESTGTWRFEAKIPTNDGTKTYKSSRQSSLRPGEYREIVLEFDNIKDSSSRVTFKIEVDSDDDVNEERESNNDDSISIKVD